VRIATWNILSGRSPGEDAVDEGRFAEAVRSLDVDVLGLQEVDRSQPRSGKLDLTTVAAEAMGARQWMFAPALAGTPGSWRGATGREADDVPTYGIAFLSRYRVDAWDVVPLPPAAMPVPYRWPGSLRPSLVRDEPRVAIVAEVAAPHGPLRVVTTHLSFLPTSNGAQLRLLVRRLAERSGRLVLMGDLNMGPRRADRLTGLGALATGWTFPAVAPSRQIDHILGRGVIGTGRPVPLPLSDHQALVADV
jgi:endonuclease/exonuclease/phosphatase family metal-dependent hydrolase